ncbi:hypothetical protein MNBD_CHLOROFLEXI01-716 [hydrothermal vent metagenome]|uniref:HTH cro/C1-type domain-containing protein n=1 Tax=hydrothermal vent metagenome TaxID=652676 RepID=A0A3B0UW10_9ZZZZ
MRFAGKIYQNGDFWLAEIPILDVMTQGYTQEEAMEMVADLVETMANTEGFHAELFLGADGIFEVGSTDLKIMIALLLQRKRELSGLSLSQAAEQLGASSRNAYARYEQGQSVPSIVKLNELLRAISPNTDFVISDSVLV